MKGDTLSFRSQFRDARNDARAGPQSKLWRSKAQRPAAVLRGYARDTFRHYRGISDELADREIEQCRRERERKNGNAEQAEPPSYCECVELMVNGKRVPCPEFYDCGYVEARSRLVDTAVSLATLRNNGSGNGEFNRVFAATMEELPGPLLRRDAMPIVKTELDTSQFEQAIRFAFEESEKSVPEIINRAALVAIIGGRGVKGAMQRTPRALAARIKALPVQKIARYVLFKHRGEKLTRKQIARLIGKEYRRRIAAIGYTALVGWNKAALAFGGRGIGRRAQGGRNYAEQGSGKPARAGDYSAEFTNTAPAAILIGEQALQEALDDTAQDMVEKWERKTGAIFQSQSAT